MADTNDVSLLQYARFYGIATDYTNLDLLQHIDEICEIAPDFLHSPRDAVSLIEQNVASTQQLIEQDLHHEKLDIRKESVQFLSSVLRDITRDNIDVLWDKILPSWDRYDDLKLEAPLFSSDNDTYLALPAEPLRYFREEDALCSLEGLTRDYDSNLSSKLMCEATITEESARDEKLDCSKAALLLIQGARQAGNRPPDWDDLLRPLQDVAKEDQLHLESPPLCPLDDDCFSSDGPLPNVEEQALLSPVTISVQNIPCDVDTLQYNNCTEIENTEGAPGPQLESHLGNYQVSAKAGKQLSHDPASLRSSSCEQDPPLGRFTTDMDVNKGKELSPDAEQIIMAMTIPSSSSSVTSQVTYTEITDNIATSDCFPYENCILKDLPFRPSYSPNPPACSSSHQEARVNQFPNCSAQSDFETLVPGVRLVAPAIEGDVSVTSYHPETLPGLDSYMRPSSQSLMRKRKLDDMQEDYNRTSTADQKSVSSTIEEEHLRQNLTSSLGSLSRFMEIRGQATRRDVATQSHYFLNKVPTETSPKEHGASLHDRKSDSRSTDRTISRQPEKSSNKSQIPHCLPGTNQHIMLSLSTNLLKSHLRLVQCLERMGPATSIVYRDPGAEIFKTAPGSRTQMTSTLLSNCEDEADIVIPPNTGIILSTSQATTQLFLPGHKPAILKDISSINSPLRERIFRLAKKYRKLYVLISHCSGTTSSLPDTEFTIDKNMLSSLTAFAAFCSSMSNLNIHPVVIPSSPDTIASWILVLASKSAKSQV
ncbi:hypothetical protein AbraIFM66951_008905 [Aspergillus brasiliensis]|uniref:DUF7102 domain-containing protein n=1 Tax=Aspergillus brasiliensis TaxID=319629 RepID=A0A9W5YW76_9EURO|nr:hypothetical protein AbraCBS73388_010710 [Aspergillus brasiliensis]GKZ46021.1 hypothetical protein AbraIFM66951_008905 [Aspergillus brasiliensis]